MGIPDIKRAAKMLGDYSTLTAGGIPEIRSALYERGKHRGMGWVAGRTFGFAKANFGIVGLFAFAEFISYLNMLLKAANSSEYWVGNMTRYAGWVDRGFVHYWNGLSYPPTYFYRNAVSQAVNEYFAGSFFTGYGFNAFQRVSMPKNASEAVWKARTGIYEGQKFLGDMFAVLHGDIGGRVARREAGRATAGFVWGTLLNPSNMFKIIATKVVANARRNIKTYPSTSKRWQTGIGKVDLAIQSKLPKRQRVIYDTGMLWATMAMGETEYKMMQNSYNQGRAFASAKGFGEKFIDRRMSYGSLTGRGAQTLELHGPAMGIGV